MLLLDGTWNDADLREVADTNVVRLRQIISKCLDPTPAAEAREAITPLSGSHQFSITARSYRHGAGPSTDYLVFYERGVGTNGFLNALGGGAFGVGLAHNIRRAYIFLARNYDDGDEIFIFGFSRGSYTARSLVGYVSAIGLLKCEYCDPAHESKAWYYYRTNPTDRLPTVAAELKPYMHAASQIRIKCLAVFDTVGALGVPLLLFWRENRDLFEFHDVTLSGISEVNLQALAVDEHREAFEPAPWRQPTFSIRTTHTEQVWFVGAHADVGGGYIDEEERQRQHPPALDDITLDWMLRRLLHYYHDFPVQHGNAPAWPRVAPKWALAPQHEARTNFYALRPFALRSIGNSNVPRRPRMFETVVCRDRHATPVDEMVHISVIERLGCSVTVNTRKEIYAPRNILAALDAIEATHHGAAPGSQIPIIGWDGKPLSRQDALSRLAAARLRLQQSPISIYLANGALP